MTENLEKQVEVFKKWMELSNWTTTTKESGYVLLNEYSEKGTPVFIGDSIVEGFPLSTFFSEKIQNRGINGDNTAQMRERFERIALPLRPSKLLIWAGTNDIGAKMPKDNALENIKAIVDKTRETYPETEIYLLSICPVNETSRDEHIRTMVAVRTNKEIKEFNAAYKAFALKENICFIDFYDDLTVNGELPEDYSFDGLHPNAKGYVPVVKKIKKFVWGI